MSGCKDAYLIISIKVKVLKMLAEKKLPWRLSFFTLF